MSIFLLILKIIGIILLSVIGIVLFLLALILFVPIRYKIKADYDSKLLADVRASYLLHIVSVIFSFDGEKLDNKIKIFGIALKKREASEKRNSENKRNKKKTKEKEKSDNNEPDYILEGFDEDEDEYVIEDPQTESFKADDLEDDDDNKGFFGKLKEYISFIYNLILNFNDKVRSFFGKLQKIKDNIVYYIDLLLDDHTKDTLKKAFELLINILKAIGPRQVDGKFRFGFDDPETTGKVSAFLAIIYPFLNDTIEIVPEFDTQVIEGNIKLKGRIFIITLLINGWKLYFNKDIRKLMRDIKREK